MKPIALRPVTSVKEIKAMLVILLSAAMTIAMLVATVTALHEEAQRRKSEVRVRHSRPFGPSRQDR